MGGEPFKNLGIDMGSNPGALFKCLDGPCDVPKAVRIGKGGCAGDIIAPNGKIIDLKLEGCLQGFIEFGFAAFGNLLYEKAARQGFRQCGDGFDIEAHCCRAPCIGDELGGSRFGDGNGWNIHRFDFDK